ncbi:MAG: hypothetical protein Tsb0013_00820 [Phycisphaerales bacterium]
MRRALPLIAALACPPLTAHAQTMNRFPAYIGAEAPGALAPFIALDTPAVDDEGRVVFKGELEDVAFDTEFGIWREFSPGDLRLLYRSGQALPGLLTDEFGSEPGRPSLSGSGHTAFFAEVDSVRIFVFDNQIIWANAPEAGTLRIVVREGDEAPGTPSGVEFGHATLQDVIDRSPLIDDLGRVSFTALLRGPGVNATNDVGLWAERGSAPALLIRNGDPVPGAAGASRTVRLRFPEDRHVVSADGQVLLNARDDLDGRTLLLWDESTTPTVVAQSGTTINTGDRSLDLLSVERGALSPDGSRVAFGAQFVDAARGVEAGGLFVRDSDGTYSLIFEQGQTLSDPPITFDALPDAVLFNRDGDAAFRTRVRIAGVALQSIWTVRDGALALEATEPTTFPLRRPQIAGVQLHGFDGLGRLTLSGALGDPPSGRVMMAGSDGLLRDVIQIGRQVAIDFDASPPLSGIVASIDLGGPDAPVGSAPVTATQQAAALVTMESGLRTVWNGFIEELDPCRTDLNGDGDTDLGDFGAFGLQFGRSDCTRIDPCSADFDGDGDVDLADFGIFGSRFNLFDPNCQP